MQTMTDGVVDYDAIKTKQQGTWASGDYAMIGTTLQIVGEELAERVDIGAGERVLDVAAGNGNATLAAARRGATVIATDFVDTLLTRTSARAAAEGLDVTTRVADAERLPFGENVFDAVVSTFGVMFTPNQEQAAAELLRVTRPGGRIGLANWTPEGFVGQMFKIVGRYAPPPAGIRSPLEWGNEARVYELLTTGSDMVDVRRREYVFRYRSATHWLSEFRTYYGPMNKAFASLDADAQLSFERDLTALAEAHNTSIRGALRIPSEYLEIVAVKK
jgi:SAM-dependent methyltransferase